MAYESKQKKPVKEMHEKLSSDMWIRFFRNV